MYVTLNYRKSKSVFPLFIQAPGSARCLLRCPNLCFQWLECQCYSITLRPVLRCIFSVHIEINRYCVHFPIGKFMHLFNHFYDLFFSLASEHEGDLSYWLLSAQWRTQQIFVMRPTRFQSLNKVSYFIMFILYNICIYCF